MENERLKNFLANYLSKNKKEKKLAKDLQLLAVGETVSIAIDLQYVAREDAELADIIRLNIREFNRVAARLLMDLTKSPSQPYFFFTKNTEIRNQEQSIAAMIRRRQSRLPEVETSETQSEDAPVKDNKQKDRFSDKNGLE